jgi:hypothetical protein
MLGKRYREDPCITTDLRMVNSIPEGDPDLARSLIRCGLDPKRQYHRHFQVCPSVALALNLRSLNPVVLTGAIFTGAARKPAASAGTSKPTKPGHRRCASSSQCVL